MGHPAGLGRAAGTREHRGFPAICSPTIMTMPRQILPLRTLLLIGLCLPVWSVAQKIPGSAAIDAEVSRIMTRTHAKGLAVAVIDRGKVGHVHAYGVRNAKEEPLTVDTVMYGASLTKTVFAYTVM